MRPVSRFAVLALAGLVALLAAPLAHADLADETTLAERFSPVVRLVLQPERSPKLPELGSAV